jgi:predicted TIM-barrel fold metal-dependent hydrolase
MGVDIIDSLSNAFTPDRRVFWDGAIAASGLQVKVRRDPADSFADPSEMVRRMDELGVATTMLVTGEVGRHGSVDEFDFQHLVVHWDEFAALADRWPGRFASLALIDPELGMRGVRDVRARVDDPGVVGCYLHTHSWNRRLDHADYYPYYAVCADRGVPMMMQVGTSGGLLPSECGRPITIDHPALYFRETPFVLSHLGWPWCDEAVAMALKFPNVYLSTAAYPPRHWPAVVREFIRGPGRHKVLFATNFPTVGLRHALGQIGELDLTPTSERALLGGTARTVFTKLGRPGADNIIEGAAER